MLVAYQSGMDTKISSGACLLSDSQELNRETQALGIDNIFRGDIIDPLNTYFLKVCPAAEGKRREKNQLMR